MAIIGRKDHSWARRMAGLRSARCHPDDIPCRALRCAWRAAYAQPSSPTLALRTGLDRKTSPARVSQFCVEKPLRLVRFAGSRAGQARLRQQTSMSSNGEQSSYAAMVEYRLELWFPARGRRRCLLKTERVRPVPVSGGAAAAALQRQSVQALEPSAPVRDPGPRRPISRARLSLVPERMAPGRCVFEKMSWMIPTRTIDISR